jgi:hypothetical protein
MDMVADPQARILVMQASLCLLPYLGNHLPHNMHLKDFNGHAPKLGLSF